MIAEWRSLLRIQEGPDPDRAMAPARQHRQTAQRFGLRCTTARKHPRNGPEAHAALTIKPDHAMGAVQQFFSIASASPDPDTPDRGGDENKDGPPCGHCLTFRRGYRKCAANGGSGARFRYEALRGARSRCTT